MSRQCVAAIGSIDAELADTIVRFETPAAAVEARACLLLIRAADWVRFRAQTPADSVCALIADSLEREECGQYLADPRVRHVLHRGPALTDALAQTAGIANGSRAAAPSALDLGESSFDESLRSSEQEPSLLRNAKQFAERFGAKGRAAQNWLDALSEAVTNAMYNAPRDGEDAPFKSLHRNRVVLLPASKAIKVSLFATPSQVAFSVTDPFGSLTATQFQGALSRTLGSPLARPVDSAGGAGLGLMMMFDRLERLVAMVVPGHETTIVGIGALTHRGGARRGRTVQFFQRDVDSVGPAIRP